MASFIYNKDGTLKDQFQGIYYRSQQRGLDEQNLLGVVDNSVTYDQLDTAGAVRNVKFGFNIGNGVNFGDDNLVMGTRHFPQSGFGTRNVILGNDIGNTDGGGSIATPNDCVMIGTGIVKPDGVGQGANRQILIGSFAGAFRGGSNGIGSIAIGYSANFGVTSNGDQCTIMGYEAADEPLASDNNITIIGSAAGDTAACGFGATAIGSQAARFHTAGGGFNGNNVTIGYQAWVGNGVTLQNRDNVVIGSSSATGADIRRCTIVGSEAGVGGVGDSVTVIGRSGGTGFTTADNFAIILGSGTNAEGAARLTIGPFGMEPQTARVVANTHTIPIYYRGASYHLLATSVAPP